MRKYSNLLMSGSVMFAVALTISACKDDEPFVTPKLGFSPTSMSVDESDGPIEVVVTLDKAYKEDITIDYEISTAGTAVDEIEAGSSGAEDYRIDSDYGEVTIAAGETTGILDITLLSDTQLEDDETIILTLTSVDNEDIEITREDEITITVTQENGLLIVLDWPRPSADGTADMDLIVRAGASTTTLNKVIGGSIAESPEEAEISFVSTSIGYPAFGCSYTWWGGTV